MDRRDALKKMAAGGATIAGASLVMTAPAFAFAAPAPTQPVLNVLSVNVNLLVFLAEGSAGCTGSSSSNSVETISVVEFSRTNVSTAVVDYPGAGDLPRFTLGRANGGVPAYVFDWTVRYQCNYSGALTSGPSVTRTWRIAVTGGGVDTWIGQTYTVEPL